jgi:predicted ATPase
MIEEPEANLHPALQSRLAELFYDAFSNYDIRFIIETHSEYILRKSQLLVKEHYSKANPEEVPFYVYYFEKEEGKKPYRMNYRQDGVFQENFGPGFFDIASQQALALIKKTK